MDEHQAFDLGNFIQFRMLCSLHRKFNVRSIHFMWPSKSRVQREPWKRGQRVRRGTRIKTRNSTVLLHAVNEMDRANCRFTSTLPGKYGGLTARAIINDMTSGSPEIIGLIVERNDIGMKFCFKLTDGVCRAICRQGRDTPVMGQHIVCFEMCIRNEEEYGYCSPSLFAQGHRNTGHILFDVVLP